MLKALSYNPILKPHHLVNLHNGRPFPVPRGLRRRRCVLILYNVAICCLTFAIAQTDVKNPSAEPSADDFLAREKAVLGDDADQFATAQDATALDADDDLLQGGSSEQPQATFDSQFPDLADPAAVSWRRLQTPLRHS